MDAVGRVARELDHPRAERGEEPRWRLGGWYCAVRRLVHRGEVVAHLAQRSRVVELPQPGNERLVAHAETEHEAAATLLGDRVRRLLHRTWVTMEDRCDP